MMASDFPMEIMEALHSLMKACGLSGNSGSEALFDILKRAVSDVDAEWFIVEASHLHGQCHDVNALLAVKN
jgi:hypothetical protein